MATATEDLHCRERRMSIKAGSFLPEIKAGEKHKSTQQHRHSDQNPSRTHTISKDDIERFRNGNKHNICVEMLRKGYHRSFSELFSLLQQWEGSRLAAGPGSVAWLQTPLDLQPDELNTLQHHLTQAEEASRAGLWCSVYDHQVGLAEYFSSPEDSWLKAHFYQRSFQTSSNIHNEHTHAAACANMANVYVEQGQWEEARQMCASLSQVKVDDAGVCVSVWRLHCRLAQNAMADGDLPLGIEHLHKAYDISTQVGDVSIEGETTYRLGLAYQTAGDLSTAQKFLNIYVDISSSLGDATGLGKAYKDLATCTESEGRLDETVQYLEKFVAVSHSNNHLQHTLEDDVPPSNQLQDSQQDAVSHGNHLQDSQQDAVSHSNQLQYSQQDACMCLGQLYYRRGQYEQSCEYFKQGYDIACSLGEMDLVQKAQVLVGCARAHSLTRKYSAAVEEATPTSLQRLLSWKQMRDSLL